MQKILIVEDDPTLQTLFPDELTPFGFEPIIAGTTEEGEKLFGENSDLAAIVMDGKVPGSKSTIQLTQEFRAKFTGPMIAYSSEFQARKDLLLAGCNYECLQKHELLEKLIEVMDDGL